jgi:hypothetical protein
VVSCGSGLPTATPALCLLSFLLLPAHAAILPEDRIDVMYHGYDGGGLQVDGPAVLVRKAYKDKVSVWGNYLVDMITSASIDVLATASEYTEERTEIGVGADYLHGKTMISGFYVNSEENDYSSHTGGLSISQDFFGDLTTLSISYARGADTVTRTGDDEFEEDLTRQNFGVSLTQILTKNLIVNLNYESVTQEGYLQSAYRQVRFSTRIPVAASATSPPYTHAPNLQRRGFSRNVLPAVSRVGEG